MAFHPKLDTAIRDAVLKAYREGEKTDSIAVLYGLDRRHPRKIAKRAGLPPRPTAIEADIRKAILEAYRNGERVGTIAKRFGVHRDTPRVIAKKAEEEK